MSELSVLRQILDLARWAPSGDNTQPWRFQLVDDAHLIVHGFDTREHCVYDLDGHPSQLSIGAMLETLRIAATTHGLRVETVRRLDAAPTRPTFDVRVIADAGVQPDPLVGQITSRSVQRRPMKTRALTSAEKQTLAATVTPGHRVVWLEGAATKRRVARLMFDNAKLRLTLPEAYQVHRDIIQWGARFSEDRVPDQALGVDPMTARLMRWIMADWRRVAFFNRYLAGTVGPRVQMDWLPSLLCSAHFVIVADRPAESTDDYIAAGRAMQRFWLTLTDLGLAMQPELTPLIFGRYAREGRVFSNSPGMTEHAQRLSRQFAALVGDEVSVHSVFMGRVGAGPAATARSTRRPLDELLVSSAP